MHDSQSPRLILGRLQHDGLSGADPIDPKEIAVIVAHSCDYASTAVQAVAKIPELKNQSAESADGKSQCGPEKRNRRGTRDNCHSLDYVLPASSPELVAVTPRRELRPLRLADSYELETLAESGEPDLISRNPELRRTVRPLTLLDRFPPFLDRREVPALAPPAHDPQASLRGVERKPAPDGKMLDRFVGSELRVAEEARRVH
jgi:hypothetical protein